MRQCERLGCLSVDAEAAKFQQSWLPVVNESSILCMLSYDVWFKRGATAGRLLAYGLAGLQNLCRPWRNTHDSHSESRLGVWLARFGKACQLANSRLDKFPLRPCPPVALRARTLDLWQQRSCQPATCGPADISSRPVLNLAASAALPSSAQLSPLDTKIANPLIRRGS